MSKMNSDEVESLKDRDIFDNTMNDAIDLPRNKGRGQAHIYELAHRANNYREALEYVVENFTRYKLSNWKETSEGRKRFYHCNHKLCKHRLYILLEAVGPECSIYVSRQIHDHSSKSKISEETLELVKQCFNDKISVPKIMEKIR